MKVLLPYYAFFSLWENTTGNCWYFVDLATIPSKTQTLLENRKQLYIFVTISNIYKPIYQNDPLDETIPTHPI